MVIMLLNWVGLLEVNLTGYVFFFFSSRRRHTRCSRDWSSDVCSSDLDRVGAQQQGGPVDEDHGGAHVLLAAQVGVLPAGRDDDQPVDPAGDQGGGQQIGRASGRERG